MRDGKVLAYYIARKSAVHSAYFGTQHLLYTGVGAAAGVAGRMVLMASSTGFGGGAGVGAGMGAIATFLGYPVYRIIRLATETTVVEEISYSRDKKTYQAYKSPKHATIADIAQTINFVATSTAVWGIFLLAGAVSLPATLVFGGGSALLFAATKLENMLIRNAGDRKIAAAVLTCTLKLGLVAGITFTSVSLGLIAPPIGMAMGFSLVLMAILTTDLSLSSEKHPEITYANVAKDRSDAAFLKGERLK